MNTDLQKFENRYSEIKTIFNKIAKLIWIPNIINISRFSIKWNDICYWDFFKAFHSEIEDNYDSTRWYIFETEDKKYLVALWDTKNLQKDIFEWYSLLDFNKLVSNPEISKYISEIKQIERDYRKERWIMFTDTDEIIHKILGV